MEAIMLLAAVPLMILNMLGGLVGGIGLAIQGHWSLLFGGIAWLGGVDKFEPVSCGGEVDHAEEAAGQLVVAGGNCAVDLEVAEHALDAVALLVELPVIIDPHPAV